MYHGNELADTLKVTECELLGPLPPLLRFQNGTPVASPADWPARRKELLRSAVELQYGGMPPEPESVDVHPLYDYPGGTERVYRVTVRWHGKALSFRIKLVLPEGEGPFPVIVDGDLSFRCVMSHDFYFNPVNRGIAWAVFDRTELADDVAGSGRGAGPLKELWPGTGFSTLSAWAWGYSRVVDALEKLDLPLDLKCIAFSGASRGGKCTALAGAVDKRAAVVNPVCTCAGACGCYRVHMKASYLGGNEARSETLDDIMRVFPFWMGAGMETYRTAERDLPFDAHFLKALIAPRILVVTESAGDVWSNPIGSWLTSEAAAEVYSLLGVPENLYWYYKPGGHSHSGVDTELLSDVILHMRRGTPLPDAFFRTPFAVPEGLAERAGVKPVQR